MAPSADERSRKTLYVTGYNPKLTTKHLLTELFTQGGPISDVTMMDTHAYVLFQHEESVAYCLALFNEIELHGNKLRISPRNRGDRKVFSYLKYLQDVRTKLRDQYFKITPPDLPAKIPTVKSKKLDKNRARANYVRKPKNRRRVNVKRNNK